MGGSLRGKNRFRSFTAGERGEKTKLRKRREQPPSSKKPVQARSCLRKKGSGSSKRSQWEPDKPNQNGPSPLPERKKKMPSKRKNDVGGQGTREKNSQERRKKKKKVTAPHAFSGKQFFFRKRNRVRQKKAGKEKAPKKNRNEGRGRITKQKKGPSSGSGRRGSFWGSRPYS